MRSFACLVAPAAALVCCLTARAEDTRYILAPTLLQADPAPDAFRQGKAGDAGDDARDLAALNAAFRQAFEAAFPGGHRPLSLEARLDPDEPSLLVVPRLSVVRLNRDTLAGSLDRLEAVVVGDVTLVEPWSMSRLFAATRMANRTVEVSRDRSSGERASLVRKAFDEAARAWVQDCLAELQRSAHPFSLKANILAVPGLKPKGGGGFWPFGRHHGLKTGQFVMGVGKGTARVREVFDRFCVLESTADPASSLSADQAFRATVVGASTGSFAERQEPRVAVRWVGPAPELPCTPASKGLGAEGWCALYASYLSKGGGLRLLPMEAEESHGTWAALADLVKNFAMRNRADALNEQDVSAQRARELPERVVELGLPNAYRGRVAGDQGGMDQRLALQWGSRWMARVEGDDRLRFRGVAFRSQDTTTRTRSGIRELDLPSLAFGLGRDGIIHLATEVSGRLRTGDGTRRGTVKPDGTVAREGAAPVGMTQVRWFRSLGQVVDAQGQALGSYFAPAQALKASDLGRCRPGDRLEVQGTGEGVLAAVLPADLPEGTGLRPEWVQARLAAQLQAAQPLELVLLDRPTAPADLKAFRVKVDAPTLAPEGELLKVGAAWRLRLFAEGADLGGEPLAKQGILSTGSFPAGHPYQPADRGLALHEHQGLALNELVKRAHTQGLFKVLP